MLGGHFLYMCFVLGAASRGITPLTFKPWVLKGGDTFQRTVV